jgi:hypothetical protein
MQLLLWFVSNIGWVVDFNFGFKKEKRVPRVTYVSSRTVTVHGRKLFLGKYETTIIMVYDGK